MKNLVLSLIMVVSFVAVSTAQQKEVVKEKVTKEVKEVKKCDANCIKPCCADKKAAKHAECKDHQHGEAKKCDSHGEKKACCADKKEGEKKACCSDKKEGDHKACSDHKAEGHKHGEAKKCGADCTKPCCADKKAEAKTCEPGCTKACCADKKAEVKKEVVKVKDGAKVVFACPMKCERDKTYAKEGKCPKCNMFLKPVKN